MNYFDDYCIAAETNEEYDKILNKIINSAKSLNIRFNLYKLQYCQKTVKFMGHIVNELGIKPDPEQIKAILQLKKPNNKKKVVEVNRYV